MTRGAPFLDAGKAVDRRGFLGAAGSILGGPALWGCLGGGPGREAPQHRARPGGAWAPEGPGDPGIFLGAFP